MKASIGVFGQVRFPTAGGVGPRNGCNDQWTAALVPGTLRGDEVESPALSAAIDVTAIKQKRALHKLDTIGTVIRDALFIPDQSPPVNLFPEGTLPRIGRSASRPGSQQPQMRSGLRGPTPNVTRHPYLVRRRSSRRSFQGRSKLPRIESSTFKPLFSMLTLPGNSRD